MADALTTDVLECDSLDEDENQPNQFVVGKLQKNDIVNTEIKFLFH